MKPVTLRPLATFCLSFYLFAIIVSTDSGNKLPIAAALFALSVLLFFIFRRTNRNLYVKSVAIIVLALSAALAFTAFTIDKPMREYSIYEGEHHVTGKICNVEWTSSYSCGYVAKIMEVDGETVELKVALSGDDIFRRGDIFEGDVVFSPLKANEDFDSRRYYLGAGAFLAAEGNELVYTGQSLDIIDRLADINESLSARFVILMGEREGGLAASMFLGNRDYLKDDFYGSVKRLGLAHVIALSGMHLTVICAMLSIFLSNIGAKASRLCTIPIVAFYIIITGFFASIVRAGIMLACYNLITFSKRATDQPTNLGLSAVLIVLVDPCSLFDIGFQLSVAAMLGVFATLKIMGGDITFDDPKTRTIKAFLLPVGMSVISMAFTMIPVVIYFGYITPAAIIATVPFAWFGDLILWMSPFVMLLGGIPFIGEVVCTLCSYPCIAFDRLAILLGSSDKIVVNVSETTQICLAFAFAITFMIIFVLDSKKSRRIFLGISMAFLAAFIAFSGFIRWKEYNSVICYSFYEKSGEGIVTTYKDDCIAIDISNGSKSIYRNISQSAASLKADNIDKLVILNPHKSHATYIKYVTDEINLSCIYMPDEEESRNIALSMPDDIEIVFYSPGDCLETEKFKVLTYEDVYLSRSKVPVVRLKIESDGESFFYLGAAAEEANVFPEKCNNLLIGSYGPKYKSKPSFDYDCDYIFTLGALNEFYGLESVNTDRTICLYHPKFLLKFLN